MLRRLAIPVIWALGGCQAAAPAPTAALARDVSPALVLPGTLLSAEGAWPAGRGQREYGRNDQAIALAASPPAASPEWVEVRSYERLSTTNGRPREHSSVTVRTSRIRAVR